MKKKRKFTNTELHGANDLGLLQRYQQNEASSPPDGLSVYRLLIGKDDSLFSKKVSEALELGYQLHGSPSIAFNAGDLIAAQAVIWPGNTDRWQALDDDIPF